MAEQFRQACGLLLFEIRTSSRDLLGCKLRRASIAIASPQGSSVACGRGGRAAAALISSSRAVAFFNERLLSYHQQSVGCRTRL
jgi:hypothetical protein